MTDAFTPRVLANVKKQVPGWAYENARNVCAKVQSGKTPKDGFRDSPGIPFLKVYNIVAQAVSFDYRPQYISDVVHKGPLSISQTFPGDVLMNIVGPPLGKVAIVPDRAAEWNINQAITLFRPSDRITSKWIYYFLCSGQSIADIVNETRGSAGQVNISLSQCRDFIFPVPPVSQQLSITEKLDTLFERIDACRMRLEKIPETIKRFRQAVLAAAVFGKLTENWRTAFGLVSKETDDGSDFNCNGNRTIPSQWRWQKIAEVGSVRLGRQRAPKHHNGEHMRPYLRVANVFEDRIDTTDVLSMNFTPNEFETYALRDGDILLNEGQSLELVGRPAIYHNDVPGACFQNTLVRFRAHEEKVLPEFAQLVFLCYFHDGTFQQIAKWTTNIAHLGGERFAELPFPLPPKDEQAIIVARSRELLRAANDALHRKCAADRILEQLGPAILAKAFRGELVPQDPTDAQADVVNANVLLPA